MLTFLMPCRAQKDYNKGQILFNLLTSPTCLALKSTSVVCSCRTVGVFSAAAAEDGAANGSSKGDAEEVVVSRENILVMEIIFVLTT